jgi:hypothetical protein
MTTTKYGGYTAAELRALTEQPHFNVKSASIIRDLLDALSARAEATQAGAARAGIPLLTKDHAGMRVDYSGMLKQARAALARGIKEPALAEMLRQLQDHITELGTRWYAGDASVVDELLQLYCVEKAARDALAAAPQPPVAEATQKCDGSGAIPVSVDDWTECPSCNGAGCRPVPHKWNDEGEQCTKCGDKDWMADASCSERLVKSPGMTSEEILLIASRTLDADTAPPASEVVKLARALFAAAPQAPVADESQSLDDRAIADIVNRLRDTAKMWGNTQQIRERIADIVVPVLKRKTCAQAPVENAARGDRTVDELAMLVKQLVHSLRRAAPDNALADRAVDYLTRRGLQGSPLRVETQPGSSQFDGAAAYEAYLDEAPQPARASEADRATALLCRDLTDDDMDKLITWLGEHERNEIGHQGLCDRIISAFARTPAQLAAPLTDDARDAARYRWLSRQAVATRSYEDHTNRWEVDYVLRGMSFGAAIDAARAALQSHSEREA